MSLSKKQKLKALGNAPAFMQKLTYIEQLSVQLSEITSRTAFKLRVAADTKWSLRIYNSCKCDRGSQFNLTLRLCFHCLIVVPITCVLKYSRKCGTTNYTLIKYNYSVSRHLDSICGALEQAIVDALAEKKSHLDEQNLFVSSVNASIEPDIIEQSYTRLDILELE